jgi:DNA adenine methylase
MAFSKGPFRYPGGKFYALKHLEPFWLGVDHDEYREPFVGGGSVFFAKPKASSNWVNDIDPDLIITYQVIQDPKLSEKLMVLLHKEIANKERHKEIKHMSPKGKILSAFKYFYLNRTSYSGITNKPAWGYKDGKSSPPINWGARIRESRNQLANTKITCLDFEEVISAKSKHKSVLIYLDPPYFAADQKRAYTFSFQEKDHARLATALRKTKFNFMLSYDDNQFIRTLYKGFNFYSLKWLYNTANIKDKQRGQGSELMITNYKLKNVPLFEQLSK